MEHCPKCKGDQGTLLGRLGNLLWFRCRFCGWEFYIEFTPEVFEDNYENEFTSRGYHEAEEQD